MERSWKNDPRLKNMDRRKLDLLTSFADKIAKTPKEQLLSSFMELNLDAQKQGLQFTDQETGLLTDILTEGLPEEDRKKLDTLRFLSRKLAWKK